MYCQYILHIFEFKNLKINENNNDQKKCLPLQKSNHKTDY